MSSSHLECYAIFNMIFMLNSQDVVIIIAAIIWVLCCAFCHAHAASKQQAQACIWDRTVLPATYKLFSKRKDLGPVTM